MRQLPFQYRTLCPDDAEAWQALRLEAVRDFPMGFLITLEETLSVSPERCREILGFGNTRGVLQAEKLVGFCGYRRQRLERTRHRAETGPFFVSRGFQGSGAAKCLMQGVIDEARKDRVAQLELYVDSRNGRAIAFYEREGFERLATLPDAVRFDSRSHDDFFYRLKLGG